MRYRTGSDPQQAQEQVDGMIVGSAIIGLVLASGAYLIYIFFK